MNPFNPKAAGIVVAVVLSCFVATARAQDGEVKQVWYILTNLSVEYEHILDFLLWIDPRPSS